MSRAGAAIAKRQWDRLEEARLGGIRHKGAVERDARLSTAMATWRSGAVASLLVPGSLPLGLGPGRLYHGDIAAWTSHALNPRAGQREGGRGSLLHEPGRERRRRRSQRRRRRRRRQEKSTFISPQLRASSGRLLPDGRIVSRWPTGPRLRRPAPIRPERILDGHATPNPVRQRLSPASLFHGKLEDSFGASFCT